MVSRLLSWWIIISHLLEDVEPKKKKTVSGQIIATSSRRLVTPNGGDSKGIPSGNPLNSGLGIIVSFAQIYSNTYIPSQHPKTHVNQQVQRGQLIQMKFFVWINLYLDRLVPTQLAWWQPQEYPERLPHKVPIFEESNSMGHFE